jgi:hypothetical protein
MRFIFDVTSNFVKSKSNSIDYRLQYFKVMGSSYLKMPMMISKSEIDGVELLGATH